MPPQTLTQEEIKALPLETKGHIYITDKGYWRTPGHGISKTTEEAWVCCLQDYFQHIPDGARNIVTFIPLDGKYC